MPVQTRNQKKKAESNKIFVSTPPNTKKKNNNKAPITPSKELAKLISSIDFDESKRENEIMLLQQQLLTQEIEYKLICREIEYNKIYTFIDKQLSLRCGNSFYICGSPGTGKTATMQSIINIFKHKTKQIIKINGMSLNNPSTIYSLIYNNIFDVDNIKPIDAKNKLEKYFLNKNNDNNKDNDMYIIIIDEMDGLLTNNIRQQVLYHLFGWTKQKYCKFILFGIANSIDLTDRFLPRLKQRNFQPQLLIFKSYTKEQLIKIIKYRIGKDIINKYFDDIAINLCATKIAKMYGDVRKCLEICRNALNLLLTNKHILKIGFIEMKQILSSSFESPLIDIIKNLPNHQKTIIVLSSILINKSKKI